MNTRALAVIVGTLSLALGLWAVLGDTAAMGMAAGALGFVAGLVVLLPSEDHHPHSVRNPPEQSAPADTAPDPTPVPTTDEDGEDHVELPRAALTDTDTELFSEAYLKVAMDSRLASARRHLRPVSVALLEVTEGLPDDGAGPASPNTVADAVRNTLRDSDIACRMNDGTFAIILEDTPENGAVWTVERIRRNLVSAAGHHTLWAGVACYPAHAFDGPELLAQVHQALDAAKAWNQDRIEVAVAD